MSNITVTIEAFKVILIYYEKLGFPREPLLRASGIDPQIFEINNHHVSLDAFCKFLQTACEVSGDPVMCIKAGDQSNLNSLGILGQLYRYSKSIREGAQMITKYLPVLHRVFNIYYEEGEQEVEFVFKPTTFEEPWRFAVRQYMELAMAFNRRGLQDGTQSNINPIRVRVAYPLTELEKLTFIEIFQCPVETEQSSNALVYSKEDCNRPHIFYNPVLLEAFETYAKAELARIQSTGEYPTAVRNCIINLIRHGEAPSMGSVAQQIGTTEEKLIQALDHSDCSFELILHQVRREIAQGFEEETNITLPNSTVVNAVLAAEEKERNRIAKELHDGVSGMLSALKMHFSTMQETNPSFRSSGEFRQAISMLDDASKELRNTAHNLMPEILTAYGLDEALRRYCENLQHCSTAKILYFRTGNPRRFRHHFELALYRVAQELIHNAIKHASPKQLLVQVSILRQQLLLTIEDDGCGFDPGQINYAGMGLNSIRNRIAALGGNIGWNSQPGEGTSVSVSFNITSSQSTES